LGYIYICVCMYIYIYDICITPVINYGYKPTYNLNCIPKYLRVQFHFQFESEISHSSFVVHPNIDGSWNPMVIGCTQQTTCSQVSGMIREDSMKLETILAIMECPWSLVNGNYAPLYKGYVLKLFNSKWLGQPGHISEMEMDRVSKAFVKVYDGFKGGCLILHCLEFDPSAIGRVKYHQGNRVQNLLGW